MKVIVVLVALVGCVFGAVISADQPKENITCLSETDRTVRIIGGKRTTIENFPWVVGVLRDNIFGCGGSIIAPNRILTVAYCISNRPPSTLQIRAGSTNIQSGGQIVQVTKSIIHPDYKRHSFDNAISVLWIDGSLNTNLPGISVIDLPAANTNEVALSPASIVGWGRLCRNCPDPDQLNFAEIPILKNSECGLRNRPSMICSRSPSHGASAGDYGGPVNVSHTLVGVMVITMNSCGIFSLSVNVAYHRHWIDKSM